MNGPFFDTMIETLVTDKEWLQWTIKIEFFLTARNCFSHLYRSIT